MRVMVAPAETWSAATRRAVCGRPVSDRRHAVDTDGKRRAGRLRCRKPAIASKNADTLSARIDATVEHLDQTNKWISEMSDFRDMVGEMPDSPKRIGYASTAPPVISPNLLASS